MRMFAAGAGGSGGVLRRPRTPHALFFCQRGLRVLAIPKHAPLLRPRPGSAVPPKGEVPGDFSLGLPLVGVRKERRTLVGSSPLSLRACAQPPGGAGGFARGLLLALPPSRRWRYGVTSRSLAHQMLGAPLRRFRLGGARSRTYGCALAGDPLATTVCKHRNASGTFMIRKHPEHRMVRMRLSGAIFCSSRRSFTSSRARSCRSRRAGAALRARSLCRRAAGSSP